MKKGHSRGQVEMRSRYRTFRGFSSLRITNCWYLASWGLESPQGGEEVGKPPWKPHLGTNCHSQSWGWGYLQKSLSSHHVEVTCS